MPYKRKALLLGLKKPHLGFNPTERGTNFACTNMLTP